MKCRGERCGWTLSPNNKFCPNCGKKNKPENEDSVVCSACETVVAIAKFCDHCGEKLVPKQAKNQPRLCTGKNEDGVSCGAPLNASASVCPHCGTKAGGDTDKTASTSSSDHGTPGNTDPEPSKASPPGRQQTTSEQAQGSRPESVPADEDDKRTVGERGGCDIPADGDKYTAGKGGEGDKADPPSEDQAAPSADRSSAGKRQASGRSAGAESEASCPPVDESHQAGAETSSSAHSSVQDSASHNQGGSDTKLDPKTRSSQKRSGDSSFEDTVTGSKKTYFAEFADKPFIEKDLQGSNRDEDLQSHNRPESVQEELVATKPDDNTTIPSSVNEPVPVSEEQRETEVNTSGKEREKGPDKTSAEDRHAERDLDKTSAEDRHAEGDLDKTSAEDRHAERDLDKTSAEDRHAERDLDKTSAEDRHAERDLDKTAAEDRHAERDLDKTSAEDRHAEGDLDKTAAEDRHAEGDLDKTADSETKKGGGKKGNKKGEKTPDENKSDAKETEKKKKGKKEKKNKGGEKGDGAEKRAEDREREPLPAAVGSGSSSDAQEKPQEEGTKETYAQMVTRSKTVKNSGSQNTLPANAEKVTVVFHVIVSDLWEDMDPLKYDIFLYCGPEALGAWKPKDKNKMSFHRKTDIGFAFKGEIVMSKDLRNSGFQYKYIAKREKGSKVWFELVQKKDGSRDPALVNRRFSVPQDKRAHTGPWNRYDGVAYFPEVFSQTVFERVKRIFGFRSFRDRVHKDALKSAELFLPSVEEITTASRTPATNGQTTMEGYLDRVGQVMSSLRFQMLDVSQLYVDENLVRKAVIEVLAIPLVRQVEEKRTVTLGLFILLLVENYSLPVDNDFIQTLCYFMLIRPAMNNTTCADLDSISSHFPALMADKSAFARKMVKLINNSDQKGWLSYRADPSWLFCVPLLHFLQGDSQPIQDPEPSSDFTDDQWWGLTNLSRRKTSFMESTCLVRMPQILLDQLRPAFAVDPLFVRTFVASLELEPLLPVLTSGLIPLDVMAATLAHHVELKGYLYDNHKMKIQVCLDMMLDMAKQKSQSSADHDLKEVKCSAQIVCKLHRQLLWKKGMLIEDTLMNGTYLMYVSLDRVAIAEERACQLNGGVQAQSWRDDTKSASDAVCDWLSSIHYSSGRSHALPMWDRLMTKVEEEVSHGDLKQAVKNMLTDGFERKMEMLTPDQKLEVYLMQQTVAPTFADILNRLAFESLDAAFKMGSKHLEGDEKSAHLVSLLSTFIEQNWTELVQGEDELLKFVVTWIPMVNYFKRFGKTKSSQQLSERAAQYIHRALDCIQRELKSLTDGSIMVRNLQLLQSNRQRFKAIVTAAGHDWGSVSGLLDLRCHELKAFLDTSGHLDRLLEHCQHIFITGDLKEVLAKNEEIRDRSPSLPLSEVCGLAAPDSIQQLRTYLPIANPWDLPEYILTILPAFGEMISSYIFQKMFCRSARATDHSSAELWRAFHEVWSDVIWEWHCLCKKMTTGTITLAETERVFSMFRDQDGYKYGEIQKELSKLSTQKDPGQWVDERIEQFRCFTTIEKHVQAATVLLNVKEAVGVVGDFKDIEKICSLSQGKNLPVSKVDRSVLRLCSQLEDITEQDISCLQDFLYPPCLQFVYWLNEKMKDGMKELNVFVDLAFISAGEEPWAIARVNCFHAATIGYAPLIFMEKEEGCRHLLQQCRLVFTNVKADPSLPTKLKDSSRYLDWLKDVENSLGSVEKTCLSQVGSINERGVLRIGRGKKTRMTVPSVIQLTVAEEASQKKGGEERQEAPPPRNYTYDELLDLQSRLMLVAGEAEKGKENVDRFITIMESLIRLGKTYVQLCRDGCVLFLDWTVEFLCDVKRPVCCVSEFSSQGKLKGHRGASAQSPKAREDLEEFIAGIASFLEHCHGEWLSYVDQKRREYRELNIFTVEQLVFLQQQLINVGSEPVSKHVYPMLSLLKADCSPEDLEQALQEAMDGIDASQQQQRQQPVRQTQARLPAHASDKEKVAAFMTEMRDNGFSKGLALKALQEVDPEDIAEGIAWCMKHEDDDLTDDVPLDMEEEEDEGEGTAMEEETGGQSPGRRLKEWVTRRETITQCAIAWLEDLAKEENGTTLRSLTGKLSSVWRRFLQTVSSSGMDFLSLEHLGIILQCLAAKDGREFKRVLPPNFKPKIPNLILCPRNEVLNAVTYMYMFPEEPGTPLPQPDEVLLCTEHTTFEQVDIFLRRAFFGRQQKVHCLAFADTLDYDVGEKTEKKISEYSTMAGDSEYRLVVVCTTENEFRARIVAALEKFRQPSPSLSKANMIGNYLRTRFTGVVTKAGVSSASALDPEKLSVRVVKSSRSGVGKTLYKQRLTAQLQQQRPPRGRRLQDQGVSITIPLHGRVADTEEIAACLLQHTLEPATVRPRIVHLDISYQVLEGVDHLLYSLLVLGCVRDCQGQVWLRSPMDLYLVETMPLLDHKDPQGGRVLVHQIFEVLPSLSCWSPQDSLSIMRNSASIKGYMKDDCLFDEEAFGSDMYQRPFRYLQELATQNQPPPPGPQGDAAAHAQMINCLALLLRYCGVVNPSWSEMTHFVRFLDKQLMDFEKSTFCAGVVSEYLPGFSRFVLRFLVQMSRDFATRSLKVSEESLAALAADEMENTDIEQYEMRRTWESSPHPYIFFNSDGHSMTFLGFSIEQATGNLVDHQTGRVLEQGIMTRELYQILLAYKVPLSENFDVLPREDRLVRLYHALGLHEDEIFDDDNHQVIDPDDTYELTTDNVKKILAIYMRFRCAIPVIVMGETGCGKTRLVKFLCSLQTPKHPHINTAVQVKVHGGTTGEDIIRMVHRAEALAEENAKAITHRPIYTVLFFDEANTTEAVGVIKEVMCDGSLHGQQMNLSSSLKMVAACNPYRKHSDELIERLENAGLGYHVDADKTVDKLGRVPMRRLVYRVQPLPQSMLPLVWDFGQLNRRVEELYIRQMVRRYVRNGELATLDEAGIDVLCRILMESQEFMRKLADECSFVSLRDVDRALTVASWFLNQAEDSHVLFRKLNGKLNPRDEEEDETVTGSTDSEDVLEDEDEEDSDLWDMTTALVLSLGVCYRACLRSKEEYDEHIIPHFKAPFTLPGDAEQFADIIDRCQEVFLDSVRLADNIARNQALKENLFMMVVCIELRIPLFLVGKPGSSKSLAKTIVADAMQGNAAYSDLFKTFKQAQMVSFQCSPLATADGILGTFRQCAKYQEGKSKTNFVSVVVLDEVGLAEDSPKMPLKTLHPLLEDGCPGDEVPVDSKKVAFIGISNWALDPAKMNRGILVQRDVPDKDELTETARGICTTKDELALHNMNELIPALAKAYLNIFQEAKEKREFFGLRDFYSLVKMVYSFAAQSKQRPSQRQLIAAIRRNFGGLDTIDPVKSFKRLLPTSLCDEKPSPGDPDCSPSGLIKAALSGDDMGGETRYLLLLTENYGGLSILSENLLADRRVVPIFGSSFPKDQEYTQICRNINRIKVCMETGQTVILLNLENLYESLYDALNQYYAMLGPDRFVDLGLGTHRLKCKVHRQFRLIVVAEKQAVYDKFPIPLINRLEKHFLTLNNIMTDEQLALAKRLEQWAREFVSGRPQGPMFHNQRVKKAVKVGEVFMGYHPDTAPAIVLKVWNTLDVANNPSAKHQVLEESQRMLLWCVTPDAVVRSRDERWSDVYNHRQQHEHLQQYLAHYLKQHIEEGSMLMAQVTTHSKLVTEQERLALRESLPVCAVTLLSLQAFDTEQQFSQQLRLFFSDSEEGHKLLVVQCDSGDSNQNLIKGAQYCMQDLRPKGSSLHHVVFIIQLPSVAGARFTGFLGGQWHCLHIDDMRATEGCMPSITLLQSKAPGQLIMAAMATGPQSAGAQPDLMQWEEEGDARAEAEGEQVAMEVDVKDVQVELDPGPGGGEQSPASPVEGTGPQGLDPQYVRDLFRSCIQAAVAQVRDAEEGTQRATHRIAILLDLLEENTQFFQGLHKQVASVLKERENRAFEAERWLSREAAELDTVKKAGTFRRSWMQHLENKVVPVLAGIIAYLDTNHNLDLLPSPPHSTTPTPPHSPLDPNSQPPAWVGELWLTVLREMCEIRYQDLRSPSDKEELSEFTVRHVGASSLPFSARLPFSWLLWEFVEKAIAGARSVGGDLLDRAGSVVDQSPLGRCMRAVLEDSAERLEHMFTLYVADLLHFTFPLTQQLHQLLCVCVEKGLRQLNIGLVELEVGRGMVVLHMLVEQMGPRLQATLDMAAARMDAVAALQAGGAGGACEALLRTPDEMTEDVALLRLLVEELQPRPGQLKKEEGCQEWVAQYTTVAPVILRVLREADSTLGLLRSAPEQEEGGREGEEEEEEASPVNTLPYGDKCRQQLMDVRCLWTRVTTLKLFLDFVGPLRQGPPKLRHALESVKLQLLCNLLGDRVDMKQAESLVEVDKFLKIVNSRMVNALLGKIGECTYCETKFESSPVELPCRHRLCNSCYRDSCHGNRAGSKCPECNAPVPAHFDPNLTQNQDREARELLDRYQRQISGFLMALVSQLCFAGKRPPEPAAVTHIFGYIIHTSKRGKKLLQTKNMTVHDDLIDPTPVLRSFLLRLLLKHSEQEVYGHLERFLESARKMGDQERAASREDPSASTLLEFRLLVIHCIEELHHEQDALTSTELKQEERQLVLADTLHEVMGSLRAPPTNRLTLLRSLGRLRHALSACAHILHVTFVAVRGTPVISRDLENLLLELKDVCQNRKTDWPRKFLVKQLCREYGIQDFMILVKRTRQDDRLNWIAIEESDDKVEAVADRYLMCGDQYKQLRDLLAPLKLDGDASDLTHMMQRLQMGRGQKETLLLLALHREVTMTSLSPVPDQVRTVVTENVRKLIQDCDALQDKALAQQLCDNQLGVAGSAVQVRADQDLGAQSLLCVLTHLRLVLRPGASPAPPLLAPLAALAFQPHTMANTFLPTMPEDDIHGYLASSGATVWQCPQGHRYLIDDCGNPVLEGTCSCGLKIGGQGHKPVTGNVKATAVNTTQTGHILGPAARRGLEAISERGLSFAECSAVRFLLHATLYLSASNPAQAKAVSQMVTPRIAPGQAETFFLDHALHDLRALGRSLGRSVDDAYLLLHHLCHQLAAHQPRGHPVHLKTQQERTQWEKQFIATFIAPAIQNMDTIVKGGNQAIMSDTRQGNRALLRVVYEDEGPEPSGGQDVISHPAVWRFRPPITVDHFFRQFHLEVETDQKKRNNFPVLRLFKTQRPIVQALHFLPAILRGQRRLMMQLHRRLDRAEAATLTVGEIMDRHEHKWVEQLLTNFSKAWEMVKEHLIGFQCVAPIEGVWVSLPEEFHNANISGESPVGLLLPSLQGPGLCSYVFLQFMLAQHNEFLHHYSSIVKQRYPEVSVRAVTERHIVGCSAERDLLPMVLSHSNYSLRVGQSAGLEYDFEAFQQQLQDTLLQCKAAVTCSPHFPVETMVYRADTTNSRLFKAVREKIPQECLSPAERRQIVEELRDLPDICHSVDNLNTALSFLKALGGAPSAYLHQFMTTALKMTRTVHSRKAQQLCQLTHVQSLWLVLCHQRASILAANQQDAFDGVEKELREDMTPDQGLEVGRMCQGMSVERLELLLVQLFECIMLRLSEARTQEDVTSPKNYILRDILLTNLETPLYHTELVEVRSGLLTPEDFLTFPETLRGRHATATWMLCRAQLNVKRQMLL